MSQAVRTEKARLAAKKRHYPDQDHSDTERDLAAAKIANYIAHVLAEAPPLTPDQRARLAELLRPARETIVAARIAELDDAS
jgi:hypothetical protein